MRTPDTPARAAAARARNDAGMVSTGVGALDDALGGLFRGDNVVWELEEHGVLDPFVTALMGVRDQFDLVLATQLADDPPVGAGLGVEVIDARAGSPIGSAADLLAAVRGRVGRNPRALILFDSLDAMSDRWGDAVARRFFMRACPLLLGQWAVAYWSLSPSRHSSQLRQTVDAVTQCVLVLGADRLRIAKAEGRPHGVQGQVFQLHTRGGRPALDPAPTAARLGAALRALRAQRRLTQGELARMAGVSASAISQAERGRRGLALHTLLDLTSGLDMTIDELLRGEIALGYRLARRTSPDDAAERVHPLLDDPGLGLRARLSCLAPGHRVRVAESREGVELVAVATGLIQVILPTGRPVLRQGEVLLAGHSHVTGWANIGDQEATVFLILRDELGPLRQPAAP